MKTNPRFQDGTRDEVRDYLGDHGPWLERDFALFKRGDITAPEFARRVVSYEATERVPYTVELLVDAMAQAVTDRLAQEVQSYLETASGPMLELTPQRV